MIVLGAQYYRPPNPPRTDWARDLQMMADAGFNTVKLWACWSWMEAEPGVYDFDELDELMDLAYDAGLAVVINTIIENAPYHLEAQYPAARYLDAEDRPVHLTAAMNTPGGGWPGLCFDNKAVWEAAEVFLRVVVGQYTGHPALHAWDVWNEPHVEPASYHPDRIYCYCQASIERFRAWLRDRYGSLDALNARWGRRYSNWEHVHPPRLFEAVPDMMDWRTYWFENIRVWLDRRVGAARSAGATVPVMSHVALSGFTGQVATHSLDEWTLADAVDTFGTSSFPTWLMNGDPIEHLFNLDAARAACAPSATPFWQTELEGGRGRRQPHNSTPHPEPDALGLEVWNAFAAGAKGLLFWQWRPELLGPEAPGYGLCAADGSLTERVYAASEVAEVVRNLPELDVSVPRPASVAVLLSRLGALHAFATDRNTDVYTKSAMGAHRLLIDADVAVDLIHEDTVERLGVPEDIECIYWPTPVVATDRLIGRLDGWVRAGGRLIAESAPGEYDERGWHRGGVGLDAVNDLFGATTVETDAATSAIEVETMGAVLRGAWQQERLTVSTAETIGHLVTGGVGATANACGRGTAIRLVTNPSLAYNADQDGPTREAVVRLLGAKSEGSTLSWTEPRPGLMRRTHDLPGGRILTFALNWTSEPGSVRAEVNGAVHERNGTRTPLSAGATWPVAPKTVSLFVSERTTADGASARANSG